MTFLKDLRVLDVADPQMGLAGQTLADLGADVVQWHSRSQVEGANHWVRLAYGRNKRTLEAEADVIAELLAGADVLIESPLRDGTWRFDQAAIARSNPHLIHASVSWFGRTGPKSRYAATDLIATAASGFLSLTGAPGAPPLRISCPQAAHHAAADAAVAVLIALADRARTGRGQHIDAAAQDSLTLALLGRSLDVAVGQPAAVRTAGRAVIGTTVVRYVYAARDGFIIAQPAVLPPLAAFGHRFAAWLIDEGLLEARFADWDWGTTALRMLMNQVTEQDWTAFEQATARLCEARTKVELMDEAVRRKVLLAPLFSAADLLSSPQIEARGFVRGDGHEATLGPFARFSAVDLPSQKPPTAIAARTLRAAWPVRPTPVADADIDRAPLAGVKIVDLFWVVAGPGGTRMLADYGATVIHVESRNRLDMARAVPPYIDAVTDPERAALFHTTNANKLGLSLDLGTAGGRAVLEDLIEWADVITESFSVGVIARMGFDYERIRTINPRIIMISSCLLGQTGPWRDYAGFGNLAAGVTGFHQLTGEPGATPTGCYGPYTDFVGVRYNALAILAALAHRDRTGEGQYIDMAQAESALHYLAPAALEYWHTGVASTAEGNRDRDMAPHGVYPAAGEDCWVAIAVRDDRDWSALCTCADFADWLRDDRLRTVNGRRSIEDEINARIGAWTAGLAGPEIVDRLQGNGVPAHEVSSTAMLFEDAQLAHRGHFHRIPHPQFGVTTIESSRVTLSRANARVPSEALTYGRDNEFVMRELLGYSKERCAELEAQGALR